MKKYDQPLLEDGPPTDRSWDMIYVAEFYGLW